MSTSSDKKSQPAATTAAATTAAATTTVAVKSNQLSLHSMLLGDFSEFQSEAIAQAIVEANQDADLNNTAHVALVDVSEVERTQKPPDGKGISVLFNISDYTRDNFGGKQGALKVQAQLVRPINSATWREGDPIQGPVNKKAGFLGDDIKDFLRTDAAFDTPPYQALQIFYELNEERKAAANDDKALRRHPAMLMQSTVFSDPYVVPAHVRARCSLGNVPESLSKPGPKAENPILPVAPTKAESFFKKALADPAVIRYVTTVMYEYSEIETLYEQPTVLVGTHMTKARLEEAAAAASAAAEAEEAMEAAEVAAEVKAEVKVEPKVEEEGGGADTDPATVAVATAATATQTSDAQKKPVLRIFHPKTDIIKFSYPKEFTDKGEPIPNLPPKVPGLASGKVYFTSFVKLTCPLKDGGRAYNPAADPRDMVIGRLNWWQAKYKIEAVYNPVANLEEDIGEGNFTVNIDEDMPIFGKSPYNMPPARLLLAPNRATVILWASMRFLEKYRQADGTLPLGNDWRMLVFSVAPFKGGRTTLVKTVAAYQASRTRKRKDEGIDYSVVEEPAGTSEGGPPAAAAAVVVEAGTGPGPVSSNAPKAATAHGVEESVIHFEYGCLGTEISGGPHMMTNPQDPGHVYLNINLRYFFAAFDIPAKIFELFGLAKNDTRFERFIHPFTNYGTGFLRCKRADEDSDARAREMYDNLIGKYNDAKHQNKWKTFVEFLRNKTDPAVLDACDSIRVYRIPETVLKEPFDEGGKTCMATYLGFLQPIYAEECFKLNAITALESDVRKTITHLGWPVTHDTAKYLEKFIPATASQCGAKVEMPLHIILINNKVGTGPGTVSSGSVVASLNPTEYMFYVVGLRENIEPCPKGITAEETALIVCEEYSKACLKGVVAQTDYLRGKFPDENHPFRIDRLMFAGGPKAQFLLYAIPVVDVDKEDAKRYAEVAKHEVNDKLVEAQRRARARQTFQRTVQLKLQSTDDAAPAGTKKKRGRAEIEELPDEDAMKVDSEQAATATDSEGEAEEAKKTAPPPVKRAKTQPNLAAVAAKADKDEGPYVECMLEYEESI